MEVDDELRGRILGGTEIVIIKKKVNSMYWSNLFVWFSNSKCSLWNKITVAGWESVVCRVFCIACPVFILLRHRDFIFDTLMTSIHSETLGSISFSYVCVWLTVGSVCVCGVSLTLLKSYSVLPRTFCINSSLIGRTRL